MRVGIDVDGVLACFFKGYEDLIVNIAGVDLFPARYPQAIPPVWNWPEHYGYDKSVVSEAWRQIKSCVDFWHELDALPGADEFLSRLYSSHYECYFITDRPGLDAQWQTFRWLEERGFYGASVILSRKGKAAVCNALSIDYYLDDKPENVVDVIENSPETKVRLLTWNYNKDFQSPYQITRVDSLNQFATEIDI